MSIVPGFPPEVGEIIQSNLLQRRFQDALYSRHLFRGEAKPMPWVANQGERIIFTRKGLMTPKRAALIPGKDPEASTYGHEQFSGEVDQLGDSIETSMMVNFVTLASKLDEDTQTLGLNAAESLNFRARNRLFVPYAGGETMTTADAPAGALTISVANLAGFREILQAGRLVTVGVSAPLPISFVGAEPDNSVIGFSPALASEPDGPGTLTLLTVVIESPLTARTQVRASTGSIIRRSGGGADIDAMTSASILTLSDIQAVVANMRQQKVPAHADGYYHVHLSPIAHQQIFADTAWRQSYQSLPDSMPYREFIVGGPYLGCIFYENTELPTSDSVIATRSSSAAAALSAPEVGCEIVNDGGVLIGRVIITGGGMMEEKWLDESRLMSIAGATGKIGNFSITNNGVAVMTDRIRYIIRSPLDKLQQNITSTWSWSGDFIVPTDQLTGNGARFKRAGIIEHAIG